MKILIILISATYICIRGDTFEQKEPWTNIWPYPQSLKAQPSFYSIDAANFNFIQNTIGKCDLLDKLIKRYKRLIFVEDCSLVNQKAVQKLFDHEINIKSNQNYVGVLNNITISIDYECDSLPFSRMNESYTLEISKQKTLISSENIWGVIRAMETLSQLIQNIGLNQFIINTVTIEDFPRFAHRGLMLDTSRHFIPISKLEQNLDAMAFNKMNVFHWHMVDDQSFPYVSKVYPNLSLKGAYNPKTHIYSAEDINHIIDYAKERGIRVLIELDTPGHAQSWGLGQPGLLTQCYNNGKVNGKYGPIDPTKNTSYEFIKTLYKEVVQRFPDQYLHLGGDEVDNECWKSNPDISAYMSKNNLGINYAKLEGIYISKVIEILKALKRDYIVWQDVFDEGVDIKPGAIFQVWREKWEQKILDITKQGHQVLLSSCWYLSVVNYGTDWHPYYKCDPQEFGGTAQQNKLVIGGEACLWGEWLDGTNIIDTAWPRAIAVAERLWSPKCMTDWRTANDRFSRQRCLMLNRGINAAPTQGMGFCQCDYAV